MSPPVVPTLRAVVTASCLLVAACDGGSSSGADAGTDGHAAILDAFDMPDPSAPRILSLQVNAVAIDPTQTLTVTAIVTDPDGIDDLIGGTLGEPASARSYGAFATSATEGAYQISLPWQGINTVAPIDAPPGGAERTFRATFYDVAGHAVQGDVVATLRCRADPDSACAGRCFDLATDEAHCGACDRACPDASFRDTWCGAGVCTREYDWHDGRSCDVLCALSSDHPRCASARWAYDHGTAYPWPIDGTCADTPPPVHEGYPFELNICVCQE